jgi:hypothetical protein
MKHSFWNKDQLQFGRWSQATLFQFGLQTRLWLLSRKELGKHTSSICFSDLQTGLTWWGVATFLVFSNFRVSETHKSV